MTQTRHLARFWLATVAALIVMGSTFSLGQWQLRRAAQKEGLQSAIEAQSRLPVMDLQALLAMKNIAEATHREITLTGVWRHEHTLYLDNRQMNGKPGFIVLTPLLLNDSSKAIAVQRGWVPRNFSDRSSLLPVATPVGNVTVHGRIAPLPSKLYEFKGVEKGHIRQNFDLSAFAKETGLPVLSVSLLQTGAASEGLLREWAAPNLGVEKHYGYAFQWFGMSAVTVFLYLWFQFIQPLRRQNRANKTL